MNLVEELVSEARKGNLPSIIKKYNEEFEREKQYELCLALPKKFYVYVFVTDVEKSVQCLDGSCKKVYLGKVGKSAESFQRYNEVKGILEKYFTLQLSHHFPMYEYDKGQTSLETMARERIQCTQLDAKGAVEGHIADATDLKNVGKTEFVWISKDTLDLLEKGSEWNEFKGLHIEDIQFKCVDCKKTLLCPRNGVVKCQVHGCHELHCPNCHFSYHGVCFSRKTIHQSVVGDRRQYRKDNPNFFDVGCIRSVDIGGEKFFIGGGSFEFDRPWNKVYPLTLGYKEIERYKDVGSFIEYGQKNPNIKLVALNFLNGESLLVVGRDLVKGGDFFRVKTNQDNRIKYFQ